MAHILHKQPWGVQVDVAMIRGGSPYRCTDLLGWLREGSASFAATDRMSASMWFHDGQFEFAHVAGDFNKEDFKWLLSRMRYEMKRRGVTKWKQGGRKGWSRFLRMRDLT